MPWWTPLYHLLGNGRQMSTAELIWKLPLQGPQQWHSTWRQGFIGHSLQFYVLWPPKFWLFKKKLNQICHRLAGSKTERIHLPWWHLHCHSRWRRRICLFFSSQRRSPLWQSGTWPNPHSWAQRITSSSSTWGPCCLTWSHQPVLVPGAALLIKSPTNCRSVITQLRQSDIGITHSAFRKSLRGCLQVVTCAWTCCILHPRHSLLATHGHSIFAFVSGSRYRWIILTVVGPHIFSCISFSFIHCLFGLFLLSPPPSQLQSPKCRWGGLPWVFH